MRTKRASKKEKKATALTQRTVMTPPWVSVALQLTSIGGAYENGTSQLTPSPSRGRTVRRRDCVPTPGGTFVTNSMNGTVMRVPTHGRPPTAIATCDKRRTGVNTGSKQDHSATVRTESAEGPKLCPQMMTSPPCVPMFVMDFTTGGASAHLSPSPPHRRAQADAALRHYDATLPQLQHTHRARHDDTEQHARRHVPITHALKGQVGARRRRVQVGQRQLRRRVVRAKRASAASARRATRVSPRLEPGTRRHSGAATCSGVADGTP